MCSKQEKGKFLTIPLPYQHFGYFCFMRFLKRLFDFYIESSVHVSLAVLSLTIITFLELKRAIDWQLLGFVFFASITGYNFVKYFGIARFHHRQLANWLKWIQILSFLCFIAMIYFALKLTLSALIFIGLLAFLTFLYAIPLFSKGQSSLRSIKGLKVYVIAMVWMGVTVLLPIINDQLPINKNVIIIAVQRLLFVLILILPFEVRDLKYDEVELGTIPQKIGISNTKILGVFLLLIFMILDMLKGKDLLDMHLLNLIITLVTGFLVIGAQENQSKYYSAFWVEALPILWLALAVVFS